MYGYNQSTFGYFVMRIEEECSQYRKYPSDFRPPWYGGGSQYRFYIDYIRIIEYGAHLGMVENNTGANNLTEHLAQAGVNQ